MTIRRSGTIAVLALMCLPLAAIAGQHGDGEHSRHMERMAEKLELTESQRSEWDSLHEAYHPRMQELRSQMREQRKALREASKEGFDEAAAEAASRRLGDLVAESSLERARMHAQLHGMLSEEQRARLAEYRHKKHDGMHGKKKHKRTREKAEM